LVFTHLSTNGILGFGFNRDVQVERVTIFDASGRLVHQESLSGESLQQGSLQVMGLSTGLYLVLISTPDEDFTSKIAPAK
jgi:hypothetical protein